MPTSPTINSLQDGRFNKRTSNGALNKIAAADSDGNSSPRVILPQSILDELPDGLNAQRKMYYLKMIQSKDVEERQAALNDMKKYLKNFNKRVIKTINLGRRRNVPFSASVSHKQRISQSPHTSIGQISGPRQTKFVPVKHFQTSINSPAVNDSEGVSSARSKDKEFLAASRNRMQLNQSSEVVSKRHESQESLEQQKLPVINGGYSKRTFDFQTKSNQGLLAKQSQIVNSRASRLGQSAHKGTIIVKGETYLDDARPTDAGDFNSSKDVRGFHHGPSRSVVVAHPSEIQLNTSRSRITDGSYNSFGRDDGSIQRKDPGM